MSGSESNNFNIRIERLFHVNGLVAVITGGGSGLGSYMARALAINGASKIFILGRREESLNEVASSVTSLSACSSTIIPVQCDITSKQSLSSAVHAILSKHSTPAIDVLICNSGIGGPVVATLNAQKNPLPFEQLVSNMWEPGFDAVTETYATNLTGTYFTIAAFLPLLDAANKSRSEIPPTADLKPRPQIITISSIGGYSRKALVSLGPSRTLVSTQHPRLSSFFIEHVLSGYVNGLYASIHNLPGPCLRNLSYGPSKSGLTHMTKQLATVLVPYNIRANVVVPGLYLSELTRATFERLRSEGKTEKHDVEGSLPRDYIPATRSGNEEDMAGIVLWLCSRAGAYVNGNAVVSDGGWLGIEPGTY